MENYFRGILNESGIVAPLEALLHITATDRLFWCQDIPRGELFDRQTGTSEPLAITVQTHNTDVGEHVRYFNRRRKLAPKVVNVTKLASGRCVVCACFFTRRSVALDVERRFLVAKGTDL